MPSPIHITVSREVDSPLSLVWKRLAEKFDRVAEFSPVVSASRAESSGPNSLGSRRYCEFKDGGYVREEIIAWEEPHHLKLRMVDSSVPMAHLEVSYDMKALGAERTKITQQFWYRMKAPLGWLSFLMKARMTATINQGLDGLAEHLRREQNGRK